MNRLAKTALLAIASVVLLLLALVLVVVAIIAPGDEDSGNQTAATSCPGAGIVPAGAHIPAATDGPLPDLGGSPSTGPASSIPGGFNPLTAQIPAVSGGVFAGVTLTDEQMRIAATIDAVAHGMGMTARAGRIATAVSMQESTLNPTAVSGPWVGLFQQANDANSGLYTQFPRTDPAGAAFMFLDQLRQRVPGYDTDPRSDWELGEIVQESHVGQNVQQWAAMAAAVTDTIWPQLTGSALPAASGTAATPALVACTTPTAGGGREWDAGNIISDEVFYNPSTMTPAQIDAFIATQNAACAAENPYCLRNQRYTYPDRPAANHCQAVPAASEASAGQAIAAAAIACGINPQVLLTKLQLESQGLTRANPTAASYDAAYGWRCPDTGPGGTANCDPTAAGLVNQLFGMAGTFANLKVDVPAGKYRSSTPNMPSYQVGPSWILWNVQETGCGGGPVTIANIATASLYVYTPYQPNAASLAAYPGNGDQCSSYGNRNFFRQFEAYFGPTGGGKPPATTAAGGVQQVSVITDGVTITLPNHPDVAPILRGKTIQAPNAQIAAGLAWGLGQLGTPYVYGGGGLGSTNPGQPDHGCPRAECLPLTGFDCSGLAWSVYYWMTPRITLAEGYSGAMSSGGTHLPLAQAQAGDLVTYGNPVHHVAIALGPELAHCVRDFGLVGL